MTLNKPRLTYANVVSTIALFLVLSGGAAFAAAQLGKESVGTRELQKRAVTAAKIRAGAVGSGQLADAAVGSGQLAAGAVGFQHLADAAVGSSKLGDGAVTTGKLADGSVTAAKLDPAALPERPAVVHRIRSSAGVEFPPVTAQSPPVAYPLENASYLQPAGEDDIYFASIDVRIPPNCTSPRKARARLFIDSGAGDAGNELFGEAGLSDDNRGEATVTVQFKPSENGYGGSAAAPSELTPHTFSLQLLDASCGSAGDVPSGITATGATIDVVGIR